MMLSWCCNGAVTMLSWWVLYDFVVVREPQRPNSTESYFATNES